MTSASTARQTLGGTSLEVSPLCLGGNRLGSELDERASFALLDEFVQLGGNFVDTALVYADWLDGVERSCSERTLGRWLAARDNRDDVVVATKGGHHALSDPGVPRLDRASLRADATSSMDHLGGPVDLYYLHRDDPSTRVEELLETLETLVEDGVIRHYAASNFSAERLAAAAEYAREAKLAGFCADQLEWSLATPDPTHVAPDLTWMDRELATFHRSSGLPVVPYSAQARGYFEKALQPGSLPDSVRRYESDANLATALTLQGLAGRYAVEPTSLALAALMHSEVQTVPVIGCRTPEQLHRSWTAVDLDLEPQDKDTLVSLAWPMA